MNKILCIIISPIELEPSHTHVTCCRRSKDKRQNIKEEWTVQSKVTQGKLFAHGLDGLICVNLPEYFGKHIMRQKYQNCTLLDGLYFVYSFHL